VSNLQGQVGELRFTIEVTRKDTGKVEKYELIGTVMEGDEDGSNTLNSGS
jgi:hypothetical protein